MAFHGDMILDATASDFEFGQIEAYNTQDLETVIDTMTNQGTANTLVLSDAAWNDDFSFTLSGPSSGTFDLSIVCESDSVCYASVPWPLVLH